MKRVLVIDDNLYNNKEYIEKVGERYWTNMCESIYKAEYALETHTYDVIVIDIMMPTCGLLKDKNDLKTGVSFYNEKMRNIDWVSNAIILFWSHLSNDTFNDYFSEGKPDNVYFLHKDTDDDFHLVNKIDELVYGVKLT